MLASLIWWGMCLCLWIIFVTFIKDDGRLRNNQRRMNILYGLTGKTREILYGIFFSPFGKEEEKKKQVKCCSKLSMNIPYLPSDVIKFISHSLYNKISAFCMIVYLVAVLSYTSIKRSIHTKRLDVVYSVASTANREFYI